MLRPRPLPTERTALLVAASSMPSRRPPRGPVLPKRSEPMPGPEAAGADFFRRELADIPWNVRSLGHARPFVPNMILFTNSRGQI